MLGLIQTWMILELFFRLRQYCNDGIEALSETAVSPRQKALKDNKFLEVGRWLTIVLTVGAFIAVLSLMTLLYNSYVLEDDVQGFTSSEPY